MEWRQYLLDWDLIEPKQHLFTCHLIVCCGLFLTLSSPTFNPSPTVFILQDNSNYNEKKLAEKTKKEKEGKSYTNIQKKSSFHITYFQMVNSIVPINHQKIIFVKWVLNLENVIATVSMFVHLLQNFCLNRYY